MLTRRQPRPLPGRRASVPHAGDGRWIIALPAWGERCVDVFLRATLPALLAALPGLRGRPYEFAIWTDQPERVEAVLPGDVPRRLLPVPGPDGAFESLSNCHRAALAEARGTDRVLLLTADMVVSREALETCERHLASNRQLVCCAAMRAVEQPVVPIGAHGRDLLAWAWENRHPMTRDCTWPDGESYDVWRMYFEREGEVAARVFLPHPLACVPRGRATPFSPTIDVNLTSNFSPGVTHMITQPEEGAVIELSPLDKEYLKTTTMRERLDAGGPSCPALIRCGNARHRMFWGRRVVIRGAGGDCGDGEVVRRVMG